MSPDVTDVNMEMSRARALGGALRVLKARGVPGASVRSIQEAALRTQGRKGRRKKGHCSSSPHHHDP